MSTVEKLDTIRYPADAVLHARSGAMLLGALGQGRELGTVLIAEADLGFESGLWAMQGAVDGLVEADRHVFMLIQSGTVKLTGPDGQSRAFGPIEAFVIPKGARIGWSQAGDVRAAYYTFTDPAPAQADASFVRIDPDAPRAPSGNQPEPGFYLSTPAPSQNGKQQFADSTNAWKAGVWDSTPYHRRTGPFPRYEFMHLLEGQVTLRLEGGDVREFGPGDTFMVPYKLVSDWELSTPARKYYCFISGR